MRLCRLTSGPRRWRNSQPRRHQPGTHCRPHARQSPATSCRPAAGQDRRPDPDRDPDLVAGACSAEAERTASRTGRRRRRRLDRRAAVRVWGGTKIRTMELTPCAREVAPVNTNLPRVKPRALNDFRKLWVGRTRSQLLPPHGFSSIKKVRRSRRLTVRTRPSQGRDTGSIPVGSAFYGLRLSCSRWGRVRVSVEK